MRFELRGKPYRWGLALVAALFLVLALKGVHKTYELNPSGFGQFRGAAFSAPLSSFGSMDVLVPDTPDAALRSSLAVFEDGRALGPAHSLHEEIATSGHGAFSHWGDYVIFSASDNSDPRANGRRYRIGLWVRLVQPWRGVTLCLGIIGLGALFWSTSRLSWTTTGYQSSPARLLGVALAFSALALAPLGARNLGLGIFALLAIALVSGAALRRCRPAKDYGQMPAAWPWAMAGLSLLPPVFLLDSLSTPVSFDSASYAMPADVLGRRFSSAPPARAPLLPLIHGLLDTVGAGGGVLIGMQVLFRAFAVFLVARAMGRRNARAGVLGGLLLALDPVGSGQALEYMSESLHSTLWLIVFGLFLAFRKGLTPAPFVFGLVLGLAAIVRTIGLPIAVVTFLVALALARSRAWAVKSGLGLMCVGLVGIIFNLVHTGHAWNAQGTYLAYPLFIQKQFSASNGPTSSQIHEAFVKCGVDSFEQRVDLNSSNEIILGKFNRCLAPGYRRLGDSGQLDHDYSMAYREALASHPLGFSWAMVKETLRFVALPISLGSDGMETDEFCVPRPNEDHFMDSYRRFVCPLPYPDREMADRIRKQLLATGPVYQPYLHLGDPGSEVALGAAGMIWMAWLAWVAPSSLRLPVLIASLLISLSAVGTAMGQVAMLRYVAPVAPLFLVLSAIFATLVLDVLLVGRGFDSAKPAGLVPTGPQPSGFSRRIAPAGLAMATVGFSLLFGELALRGWERLESPPAPPQLRRDRRLGWDSIPRAKRVGEGRETVVFVGDSFTQSETWPDQALGLLRDSGGPALAGFNLGVAGFGTTQEWLKTRDWMDETHTRPKALVLLFFAWNDLRDNLAAPTIFYNHQTRNRPYWRLEREGFRLSTPFFWPSVLYDARITERVFRLIDEREVSRNRTRSLDTAAAAGAPFQLYYSDPRSWDPLYRTEAQASPYVTRAWESTERALAEFKMLAQERNIPLVVLALDNAFTVDRDVFDQWVPQPGGFDPALPLARLSSLATKLNLDLTNLQPRLSARARRMDRKIYMGPRGNLAGHLKPQGNEEVARAAAEALARVLARPPIS